MDNLTKTLRTLRSINGLSQENMAEKLYMTQSAYSKIERQDRAIRIATLEKIAQIAGVDFNSLMNCCRGVMPISELVKKIENN